MLLIETFIAASRLHGVGLFPKENVEAGTIISIYENTLDQSFGGPFFDQLSELTKTYIKCKGFCVEDEGGYGRYYVLYMGDERYINHSKQNNLQFYTQHKKRCIVAIKDIQAEEELLLDYSEFDQEQYKKINDLIEKRDASQWPPKIKLPIEK